MPINYAEQYSAIIDERFSEESITELAINKNYDFNGVNKVNVYSIPTVELNDYNINANTNRYGTPIELGNDIQELILSQDKSFTFTIDRRNNIDTEMVQSAASALARQIKEVIVPTVDKYRIGKWATGALAEHMKTETIDDTTAYSAFLEGSMNLFDAHVPPEERIAFVSPAFYKAIKLDKNFTQASDKAYELAINGVVGLIDKTRIVVAPTDYFPQGINFIITHPSAMTAPTKIADYKQHENPQGINGWLIEGRIYYDAFILNNKRSAIYVSKTA